MMAMPMQKVAIVGHSFVNHLREFVRSDRCAEKSFGLANAEVRFFGVSGLAIGKLRQIEHSLRNFGPTTVVLLLGDNDIGNGVDAELLTLRLVAAVAMIQRWAGTSKVIRMDICPRFWVPSYKYFCEQYEETAMYVNADFREQVQMQSLSRIFSWSCRGLSFHDARRVNWKPDGVHLQVPGNSLLYQGIRKALHYFKHL